MDVKSGTAARAVPLLVVPNSGCPMFGGVRDVGGLHRAADSCPVGSQFLFAFVHREFTKNPMSRTPFSPNTRAKRCRYTSLTVRGLVGTGVRHLALVCSSQIPGAPMSREFSRTWGLHRAADSCPVGSQFPFRIRSSRIHEKPMSRTPLSPNTCAKSFSLLEPNSGCRVPHVSRCSDVGGLHRAADSCPVGSQFLFAFVHRESTKNRESTFKSP